MVVGKGGGGVGGVNGCEMDNVCIFVINNSIFWYRELNVLQLKLKSESTELLRSCIKFYLVLRSSLKEELVAPANYYEHKQYELIKHLSFQMGCFLTMRSTEELKNSI